MADKKKETPRDMPVIFKDVMRALGFGPVVDRKKKIKEQEKKANP